MSNDKMREEFEAAIAEEAGQPLVAIQLSRMADSYSTSALIYSWWAWQASRKAIEIELPETPNRGIGYGLFDAGKERCAEAIEAAGLKVKR
jgi:hypothetical protein